jgi:hypothetical protein
MSDAVTNWKQRDLRAVVRVGGGQNEPRTVSDKCEDRGILGYGLQYLGADVAAAVCSAG